MSGIDRIRALCRKNTFEETLLQATFVPNARVYFPRTLVDTPQAHDLLRDPLHARCPLGVFPPYGFLLPAPLPPDVEGQTGAATGSQGNVEAVHSQMSLQRLGT